MPDEHRPKRPYRCLHFENEDTHLHRRPSSSRRRRKRLPIAADPELIPNEPVLLAPPTTCEKCGAKKFQYEPMGFCCSKGQVKIATNSPPLQLCSLFTGSDEKSLHFQKYCRLYNNLFAFSSLAGNINCQTSKGIYVFKLHGQLYHFLPNLIPQQQNPKYLQLYFYDAENEFQNRTNMFQELCPEIISILMDIVKVNPYTQFFQSLRERHIDEFTTIHIKKNPSLDQRVYNAPTSNEVAGILLDSTTSSESVGPYIVVTGKNNTTHRIMHYYGCYDPLQYPLLFPYGESGWRPGLKRYSQNSRTTIERDSDPVNAVLTSEDLLMAEESLADEGRQTKEKDISCREYYCFMLQLREGNFILETKRLLQQFVVDMYVKLENTRLDFFRNNQGPIRADLYQGIIDTAATGEDHAANVGHRVILPPSFIGGPRDMRRRYLNAMELVQRFGKPDLFLTMTCNPNWEEIQNELRQGEQAQNRPDLITRIFRAKLYAAKKLLIEEKIFGEVAAYIYVVEFQKRGLPHAHFLVILKDRYKIRCPEEFDKFISAEIPPPTQPYLRRVVLQHMMHGPCGDVNPNCSCMRQNGNQMKCKYRYPRNFAEYTTTNSDGYPLYKRANNGDVVTIRRYAMDNRWVIPYNPYLLAYFDCHFNVEICSTVEAVKYMYKYVYKGHDRIAFNIVDNEQPLTYDEIERYQSGRWVSPPEAAWRIFGFDLYEMNPAVLPLQVHLDHMQRIQFQPQEQLSAILTDERRVRTQLTEFFKMNSSRPFGPKYLYKEFPEHFVWNTRTKTWVDRKRSTMIGRLTFVNPSEDDRFHLRLLLAHVRGPTSYSHLLTVNNVLCSTYKEAAIKRGLVEESDAVDQCLNEAIQIHMPCALRRLFVTLLIFCNPPNPKSLWDKYYCHLSEDFRQQHGGMEDAIFSLTSRHIQHLLESMGKSFSDFNLDFLQTTGTYQDSVIHDIEDVLQAPIPEEYVAMRKQLNTRQRYAYKTIMQCVKNNKSGLFFIDGPGGTGKTFLYCALYAKIRQLQKIVLPTASSGIAASNLPYGRTAHSRFKLPIDHEASLACSVPKQGGLASLLKETAVIIWDEAPMANKANFQSLDLLLRDITSLDVPFGGKIVILGGDFRQVLPVLPHKTQTEAVEASLVSSPLWSEFQRLCLDENMRAREDPAFCSYLLAVGEGRLQDQESSYIRVPSTIFVPTFADEDPINTLIQAVFPEMNCSTFDLSIFANRTILAPKNDEVDEINEYFIQRFPGEAKVYKSYDVLLDESCSIYPVEFLHTLSPGGMSPHQLVLKENCPVILLRNIDPSGGLCNGTRLKCKHFFRNVIVCEISTGWYKGQQTIIPRVQLRPSSSSGYPFKFQRTQFPIKLSFSMTINKAQGQTLAEVGIYLRNQCFSHGQLYVALSRAKKATQVKVVSTNEVANNDVNSVRNIVSFDILRRAQII